MHKALANGRMCDFYFDGVYWEMDGMDRSPEYFAAKYGELPYVVVTPEDFRFRVERHHGHGARRERRPDRLDRAGRRRDDLRRRDVAPTGR